MEKEVIIKERVEKNLQVLKLLAKDDINISEKEKTEILKGYTGWGGLREAIYTPSVYRQLKACLSDEQIKSVKNTVRSAYYTPDLLVKFIWAALIRMGFNGLQADGNGKSCNILEPAAGSGVFFNHMPQIIAKNSNIDAIEVDNVK